MEREMDFETLTYRVAAGVAHVCFAPRCGVSVVNPAFARDLRRVMQAVEVDDDVRSVVITAKGKVFSAGGDLGFFHSQGDSLAAAAADLIADFHTALYQMNRIPKPFVAAVNGTAGGAGLSMVGAFDLVVAGESATFTMAYTNAGLTPDGTSSYFISRHIGLRRMLDLTLLNRVLRAEEAEQWGLVNRVVPDDEVDATAEAIAAQLTTGPSWALGHAKRVIYHGMDAVLEQAGEYEGAVMTAAMQRHDGPEGIAAFVEKRPPIFTGE
jgi:2-(1,2-epoxy-1,2-dihydrophenyl)acetyl-CoA isomerase